jgi:hypothetical protein
MCFLLVFVIEVVRRVDRSINANHFLIHSQTLCPDACGRLKETDVVKWKKMVGSGASHPTMTSAGSVLIYR